MQEKASNPGLVPYEAAKALIDILERQGKIIDFSKEFTLATYLEDSIDLEP